MFGDADGSWVEYWEGVVEAEEVGVVESRGVGEAEDNCVGAVAVSVGVDRVV